MLLYRTLPVIMLFLSLTSPSQVILKLDHDSLSTYSYWGGDEFNEGRLNDKNWVNGLGWTRVILSQRVAFTPQNLEFKEGVLNFIADKKDSTYELTQWEIDSSYFKKMKWSGNKFDAKYTAGCIVSREKYHYGLYELRFKVEEGRGVWPAFWFYTDKEEIDAFELKGEKNKYIHVDTHCPSGCDRGYRDNLGIKRNWGGWMPVKKYLHEGFNVMLLEWKRDEVIWYINGFPLAYFKGSFANPLNLYINTSVAMDGEAFKPGPDETTKWPNRFSVDYIRVYETVPMGQSIEAGDEFNKKRKQYPVLRLNDNLTQSTMFASDYMNYAKKKRGLMFKKKKLKHLDGLISLSIDSKYNLRIMIMGELRENSSLTIKRKSGELVIKDLRDEQTIQLDKSDLQIEVVLERNGKAVSQTLDIQR